MHSLWGLHAARWLETRMTLNGTTKPLLLQRNSLTFKALATKRFDTKPECAQLRKYLSARQNAEKDVQSFANRVRMLGTATMAKYRGLESDSKSEVRKEFLNEPRRTQL
ncbi:hypothetical protein HPB48_001194 [Haemaphysalis longicornis]|uniref:Uncharacterized protein n=1 Tax=Haemaphysalis longicornis TaxID=44386 RepID=A0A9J6FI69_HAELO|nr:hypothetical protein HPB48_001194 [Haemaphysalis longicornis]